MHLTSRFQLIFCLIMFLTTSSCELFNKNDGCKGNEMEKMVEPVIYLKVDYANLPAPDDIHNPRSMSVGFTFTGSIKKFYCNGNESGGFQINQILLTDDADPSRTGSEIYLKQSYQFKFHNNNDYIRVIGDLEFWYDDRKAFTTLISFAKDVYFKDIKLDVHDFRNYIEIEFGSDNKLIEVVK